MKEKFEELKLDDYILIGNVFERYELHRKGSCLFAEIDHGKPTYYIEDRDGLEYVIDLEELKELEKIIKLLKK